MRNNVSLKKRIIFYEMFKKCICNNHFYHLSLIVNLLEKNDYEILQFDLNNKYVREGWGE